MYLNVIKNRGIPYLVCIGLTLLFAFNLLNVSEAIAYDKKVLLEDFTSSTCPPCADAAPSLEAALEETEDICVPIGFHMGWPGAGNDPWYLDNRTENGSTSNSGRRGYYGVNSIPMFFIDGTLYEGSRTRAAFVEAIEAAAEDETPVLIELSGGEVDGSMIVDVSITSDDELSDLTLYVAIVEEYYFYDEGSTNQEDYYDSMVKMIPDHNGTEFDIEADETLEYELDQEMDGLGWHDLEMDNLTLVAWVQDDDEYVHQAESFELEWHRPEITFNGYYIDDGGELGDGRAEAGETVEFFVEFGNEEGYKDAETIDITLSCDDEGISITTSEFTMEDLEPGAEADNSSAPFVFEVDEAFETHPVTFTIAINAEPGEFELVQEVTFMINWPEVLVIDASADVYGQPAMFDPWGVNDLPYADRVDFYNDGVPQSNSLINYNTMIVHTLNNTDVSFYEDGGIEVIKDFLDNGGKVILNSITACSDTTTAELLREYFKAEMDEYHTAGWEIKAFEGDHPFVGDHIYLSGEGSYDFPYISPSISALEGAREVLYWCDNRGNENGACAVEYLGIDYRTLLISFPLETMGDYNGGMMREDFLDQVLEWLDYVAAVDEDGNPIAAEFELLPAYPNPFNSQTVIPFSLDHNTDVKVSLHDIAGREVAVIFTGSLKAGGHNLQVDAGSIGLSSGVYYIQLNAGERTLSQKVTFMK